MTTIIRNFLKACVLLKSILKIFVHIECNILPISGAKRHEFPISGNPLGPGISEYGRMWAPFVLSFSVEISVGGTSFGKMLIADENAVRFTREFAAVRVPISPLRSNS